MTIKKQVFFKGFHQNIYISIINITNNTNKMLKGSGTKERISITLDKELVKILNKNCKDRIMKVSNYVGLLIKIGLEHEKRR